MSVRTVLALVAAAAMIAGALYWRSDSGLGGDGGPLARPEPAALVCVAEL